MKRTSFFRRISRAMAPSSVRRPRYSRLRLEPLEDRKLLTATNLVVANLDTAVGGPNVYAFENGEAPIVSGISTGDHGLQTATGLAAAPDGSYYVSSIGSFPGKVLHYDANGSYLGTLGANDGVPNPAPAFVPGALAFGPNGHLYVADLVDGAVYQYDTTSMTQQYLAADTIPLGFAHRRTRIHHRRESQPAGR